MRYAIKLEQGACKYYLATRGREKAWRRRSCFHTQKFIEVMNGVSLVVFSTKLIARLEAQTLSTFKKGKISVIKWTEC